MVVIIEYHLDKKTSTAIVILYRIIITVLFLVEMTGLEPAASCSQSTRATSCATSRFYFRLIDYIK